MTRNKRFPPGSVGIVTPQSFTFAEPPRALKLRAGKRIGPVTVAYETYGELDRDRSNVILVCHALTGSAHAAGFHSEKDRKTGWWDDMIGPGKAFDTSRFFIVCSNILGGCSGTTGPVSTDPRTGRPYGLSFPVVTITDMVRVQKELLDHLGVRSLRCVAGGSMGGMQVLEWMARYPEMVRSSIVIASTARLSPQAIAFDAVGRNAIVSDADWKGGDYLRKGRQPARGLSIARMIGHITYLSAESMTRKFGRRLQDKERFSYDFSAEFQVESYLHHQGKSFVERFDANTYLYVTKAMDYYDLAADHGGLENAFRGFGGRALVLSFTSDWLFPSRQSREIADSLARTGKDVTYCDIESSYGHDAFLLEFRQITRMISNFLGGAS